MLLFIKGEFNCKLVGYRLFVKFFLRFCFLFGIWFGVGRIIVNKEMDIDFFF